MKPWTVIDTPCFPCRWKVIKIATLDSPGNEDNSSVNYFKTEKEAREVANKLNVS